MVDIDVDNTPEAECLLKQCERRMKDHLGVIYLFTGETGRGKSYAGIRFLELWYQKRFGEKFPVEHICENLEQAILLVKNFTRKGEGIIIEEMSVLAGRRDALTNMNKLFNKFLDICRLQQAVIVGNVPHISFVDSHVVQMSQGWVNCLGVDFEKEIVITRPLWLQTSPHRTEPYKHKFVAKGGFPIDYTYFKKPNEEILKAYDAMKAKNNDQLYDDITLKMRADRLKKLKELGQEVLPKKLMQAYKLWLSGYSVKEAQEEMDLADDRTYRKYLQEAKVRLQQPEYRHLLNEFSQSDQKKTDIRAREQVNLQG